MQESITPDGMRSHRDFAVFHLLELSEKLLALRKGLALMTEWSEKPSILTRLRRDIDRLVSNCREIWDSVNEYDDMDDSQELASFRRSGRYYEIRRIEYGDDTDSSRRSTASGEGFICTVENAPNAGRTFAASLSSGLVSILPTLLVGTQSVFSTLVPIGTQVALPTYSLSMSGQIVLDHYSLFSASAPITGWLPQHVVTASLTTVPLFVATFAVSHSLDSLHSYLNNRCSANDAIANILRGSTAGAIVGSLYYGCVSFFGISHAPLISAGLCLGWLLTSRGNVMDLVIGGLANVAGLTTFLVTSSAWVSMLGALTASVAGSSLFSWLSQKWSERLNDRLCDTATEILGLQADASRREIESAFRKLARQCHPDKQVGTGRREFFELISVSKEILLYRIEKKSQVTDSKSQFFGLISSVVNSFLNVTVPPNKSHETQRLLPAYYLDSPD